jgi:hypothetical protein
MHAFTIISRILYQRHLISKSPRTASHHTSQPTDSFLCREDDLNHHAKSATNAQTNTVLQATRTHLFDLISKCLLMLSFIIIIMIYHHHHHISTIISIMSIIN